MTYLRMQSASHGTGELAPLEMGMLLPNAGVAGRGGRARQSPERLPGLAWPPPREPRRPFLVIDADLHMAIGLRLRREDDRRLARAGLRVPVHAVVRGARLTAGIPLPERRVACPERAGSPILLTVREFLPLNRPKIVLCASTLRLLAFCHCRASCAFHHSAGQPAGRCRRTLLMRRAPSLLLLSVSGPVTGEW
jgi:hypothetical protein